MTVTHLPHVDHDHPAGADHPATRTPAVHLPRPDEVVAWSLRILGEVGRAPFTMYRVRKLIDAMARLPDQIESLTDALNRTTDTLEETLGSMDDRLEDLQGTFVGVDGRIETLQGTVEILTGNITNLIGAIPGARRTLRTPPTAR